MKLGLGTAQFGLSYGITNTDGQVSLDEVFSILGYAQKAGVDLLDTAIAYGNSEETIGACLAGSASPPPFRIITKTLPLKSDAIGTAELDRVRQGFTSSLRKLRQTHIDSLFVHHADDLLVPGGENLYAFLAQCKAENKIKKIGVSVYDERQIEGVLARYKIDVIQVPFNVFDQRLLANGILQEMKRRDIEIHARSLFLQGILLSDPAQLPDSLMSLRPVLERFDAVAKKHDISRLEAALGFVQTISEIDYGIVGVVSLGQFESICMAHANLAAQSSSRQIDFTAFKIDDVRLVNPSLW